MYLPALSSSCCGQRTSGQSSVTSSATLAKGATARSSVRTGAAPITLSPIAPAGMAQGWLFCTQSVTCSPAPGAGSPA